MFNSMIKVTYRGITLGGVSRLAFSSRYFVQSSLFRILSNVKRRRRLNAHRCLLSERNDDVLLCVFILAFLQNISSTIVPLTGN